jgi:hypothetical protein
MIELIKLYLVREFYIFQIVLIDILNKFLQYIKDESDT